MKKRKLKDFVLLLTKEKVSNLSHRSILGGKSYTCDIPLLAGSYNCPPEESVNINGGYSAHQSEFSMYAPAPVSASVCLRPHLL